MAKKKLINKVDKMKLKNLALPPHNLTPPKQTTKEVEVKALKLLSEANGMTILINKTGKTFAVIQEANTFGRSPYFCLKELKQEVPI